MHLLCPSLFFLINLSMDFISFLFFLFFCIAHILLYDGTRGVMP
jgi:hypothetical protein